MSSTLQIKPALSLDLGDGVEMTFQAIPAGKFRMGSRGQNSNEEPQHCVLITRPFYLGTFPVTQQQFAQWKPEHKNHFPGRPKNPAEKIDWFEANDFCEWLTEWSAKQHSQVITACLPTEAQWEYACRAGTDTEYFTGDGEAALAVADWYCENSNNETQPVGQKRCNDFGLFDMHGNVVEWCVDAWDDHVYKKRVNGRCDPRVNGPYDAMRVIRGGCCFYFAWVCRSAYRDLRRPDFRDGYLGFRVCLFLGPCAEQQPRPEQANVGMATRDEEAKP